MSMPKVMELLVTEDKSNEDVGTVTVSLIHRWIPSPVTFF